MRKLRQITSILALGTVIGFSIGACSKSTLDPQGLTSEESSYLDAVLDIQQSEDKLLSAGEIVCKYWSTGISNGAGTPSYGTYEQTILGGLGYGDRSVPVIIAAANDRLCPGQKNRSNVLYNSVDNRGFIDNDVEPPPMEDPYQWGD
jgi:hypothetical protein